MGQCGPVNPCADCTAMYNEDPRYIRGREVGSPDKFVIATDYDRRKRPRRIRTTAVPSQDRIPVSGTSKRQAKARRRAKQRRQS